MVSNWKKILASLPELFKKKNSKKNQDDQKETGDLERKAGQLTMEVDYLEKAVDQGRHFSRSVWMGRGDGLSVKHQVHTFALLI